MKEKKANLWEITGSSISFYLTQKFEKIIYIYGYVLEIKKHFCSAQ